MIHSKLIQLYLTLNKEELRALKKYLKSSLHHSHKDASQLFDFLISRKKINHLSVQKGKAWKHVYPSKPYQDSRMRSLMNMALESLKDFVRIFFMLSDEIDRDISLVKALIQKNQEPMAIQLSQKLAIQLQTYPIQSIHYFSRCFQLEALQFELTGTQQRMASNNLPQLFAHSATHFMLNTLRYACIALSHSNVSTITYEIPLLQAVVEQVKQTESNQPPAVLIYFYAYHSFSEQDREGFAQLKHLFSHHKTILPEDQQQEILLMAINFCIRRLNTGEKEYAQEAFDLYQLGLADMILLEKGVISRFNFKNIVSIGLILQEFEWVESFITNYSPKLAAEFRETYQNANLAKLRFAQGAYSEAKRLLIQLDYDDIFFTLSAKMMLLKIHYEEKDWDALEALLETFSRYLERKSVIGYHKTVYQNIIRLVRSMLNVPREDREAIQQLREEITQTQPLAERDWLMRQLG